MLTLDVFAPAAARRHVVQTVGPDPRLDDILIATSEIVTNAVLHSSGGPNTAELTITITRTGAHVLVSVHQPGEEPFQRPIDLPFVGGRGLHIVDGVSDRWGIDHEHHGGLTVWFEVSAPLPTAGSVAQVPDPQWSQPHATDA